MSDEPIIASCFARQDSDEFFIQLARASCEMSIKNTGVGKWLGQSLDRLAKSEAENERLREALEKIAVLADDDPVVITLVSIANKALEGGGDDA